MKPRAYPSELRTQSRGHPITQHNHTQCRQFQDAHHPITHKFGPGRKLEYPEETSKAQGERTNSVHTGQRPKIKPPTQKVRGKCTIQ